LWPWAAVKARPFKEMLMFRPAAAALAVLALAACASEGPPMGRGGPPPSVPAQGSRARVFISPAGEPFRAAPGEPEPMRTWFEAADTDRDGALVRPEFVADHMRFFARLDTNGDGVVAGPEVSRYEEVVAPEIMSATDRGIEGGPGAGPGRAGRGGPPGGGPPGGGRRGGGGGGRLNAVDDGPIRLGTPPQPGERGGPIQPRLGRPAIVALFSDPEPVRAADADLDFRVTVAEWTAMAAARFARLDADRDNRLLFTELKPLGNAAERGQSAGRVAQQRGGR